MSYPNGRADAVKLVCNCPHCGEEVELTVTKKEVKQMMKGFQMPILRAQLTAEKSLLLEQKRARQNE